MVLTTQGEGCYWHLRVEVRDVIGHPTKHPTVLCHRELAPTSKRLKRTHSDAHSQAHLSQRISPRHVPFLPFLLRCSKAKGFKNLESEGEMATFLLFKFYWKFTNVLQTSVKQHIHCTGSQAKCSPQSLAEPAPKARCRPSYNSPVLTPSTRVCLASSGPWGFVYTWN